MRFFRFFILFLAAMFSACLVQASSAAEIRGIRCSNEKDRTRVVFDFDSKVRYESSSSYPYKLVIRLFNIDRKSAKVSPVCGDGMILSRVQMVEDGDDLLYVLNLKYDLSPKVFTLGANGSSGFRIVADLINDQIRSAPKNPDSDPDEIRVLTRGEAEEMEKQILAEREKREKAAIEAENRARQARAEAAKAEAEAKAARKKAQDAAAQADSLKASGKGKEDKNGRTTESGIRILTPEEAEFTMQERLAAAKAREKAEAEKQAAARKSRQEAEKAEREAKAAREKAELARKEAEKQSMELAKADAAGKSGASSSGRDSGSQGAAGKKRTGVFIVAVDPGHGGHDPGAIGQKGTREKDVTLGIAKELVREINKDKHMRAYLTRSGDYYVGLDRRSEIARQKKADLLVSLHADSVDNGAARGASVWVLNSNRASREMNKLIRNGSDKSSGLLGGAGTVLEQTDADQNPYLAKTILDLSWDNSRSEGYTLGRKVISELRGIARLHKSEPVYASLAVLKAPDIPSILIENGFISNLEEEAMLKSQSYQKQLAKAIYRGIRNYYESSSQIK
ncbi:MAG: N-acetylmuramoyl-L-alanine amidase [Succinivibrionaceae bacterium]|nr:N-acetylmuramoyl-L-alanine amidase [Succinivibrionaceae bacterium]